MTEELAPSGFDYAALDDQTAALAQQAAGDIRQRVRRAAQDIVEIGARLLAVKAALPHGQWGTWLESEFGWGDRQAQRFMGVAERFKTDNLSDLQIAPSALYALAAPSVPDEARQEAVARASGGEHIGTKQAQEIRQRHKPPGEYSDLPTPYQAELVPRVPEQGEEAPTLPDQHEQGEETPPPGLVQPFLKLRLSAHDQETAIAAVDALRRAGLPLPDPHEGRNPKYEGRQHWASYLDTDPSVLEALAEEVYDAALFDQEQGELDRLHEAARAWEQRAHEAEARTAKLQAEFSETHQVWQIDAARLRAGLSATEGERERAVEERDRYFAETQRLYKLLAQHHQQGDNDLARAILGAVSSYGEHITQARGYKPGSIRAQTIAGLLRLVDRLVELARGHERGE